MWCLFYARPGSAADLREQYCDLAVEAISPLALREWQTQEFMLSDPDGNVLRFGEPVKDADLHSLSSVTPEGQGSQHTGRGAGS